VRHLVLVATGLHVERGRWLDADVDVLGEPVDDSEALGERGSALELEPQPLRLQLPRSFPIRATPLG
jgi:hypothetical protein